MRARFLIACISIAIPSVSHADPYNSGVKLLAKGQISKAIAKLSRSNRAEAAVQLATLAERGRIPDCNLDCAIQWHMKAVDRGDLESIARIGTIYERTGQTDVATSVYQYGARWGEYRSRAWLLQHGLPVPDIDLLRDHQQRIVAVQAAAQAAQEQKRQERAAWNAAFMASLLGAQAAQPRYSFSRREPGYTYCPDGRYVAGGSCHYGPDGKYHAAEPQYAPDGTYVAGKPTLAPDGRYIGSNSGRLAYCPDGTYVGGTQCVYTPDGGFVGK